MELKRLLGYIKVYNNLEKYIYMYFGPKNAPECTSGHAKFQNQLGEAPQTPPPAGGGKKLPHPPLAYQSLARHTYPPAT